MTENYLVRNLLVHYVEDLIVRDYHIFWQEITTELKKNHIVNENKLKECLSCKILLKKRLY